MNLYEMTQEFQAALAELNADEDIPPEAIRDTVEGLLMPVEEKVRNAAAYLLNIEAEAVAVRQVEDRISKRRKALEGRAAWLREYLRTGMEDCGITEIKALDGSFAAKIRKSSTPTVVIDDERALPSWAIEIVHTTRILKEAIRFQLKAGEEVPGARLVSNTYLIVK